MKILNFYKIFILFFTVSANKMNIDQARCLLKVMYLNLTDDVVKNNQSETDYLLRILNMNDDDLLEQFDDLKIVSDLNSLMINFNTLDEPIK